jgi:hypothetical protein
MPTVPGQLEEALSTQWEEQQRKRPTPEHLLMTAADMKSRGQLYTHPTDYSDPKATLKLPFAGGGRGQRPDHSKSASKRR